MLPNERRERFTMGDKQSVRAEHERVLRALEDLTALGFQIPREQYKLCQKARKELTRRKTQMEDLARVKGFLLRLEGDPLLDELDQIIENSSE